MNRQSVRRTLGIPTDAVVAGFVGRFVHDKGIQDLIASYHQAKGAAPNLAMLMIGAVDEAGGSARGQLERIRTEAGWFWETWNSDIEKYYSAMDFLILPSYREGLPTVVLEAAAMQIPSIVTDATGCIDSVVDGITGVIVPVRDVDALSHAIVRYAMNPGLRKRHGRSAQDRVQRLFSRTVVQNALLDEYDRLFTLHTTDMIRPNWWRRSDTRFRVLPLSKKEHAV